ncbi:lytic murein transglycosylase, partial [Bacillus cereus]|nr:lytic murein transglycosylase [Bacillus cereus]
IVDRALVPNFVFGADDIVVALGQDGMVANTMKYLDGQPLIGVNPEPARWDGLLLPFAPADLAALLAPDILPQFTADEMAARGVQLPGSGAAHQGPLALVKLENGAQGQPLYIAGTENFYAITRYNWSSYYALSVIELGQEVATAMGR